jgi:hypothetical protein
MKPTGPEREIEIIPLEEPGPKKEPTPMPEREPKTPTPVPEKEPAKPEKIPA